MNAKQVYGCPECERVFDEEYDAENCCPRDAVELWECGNCEKAHRGVRGFEKANDCCSTVAALMQVGSLCLCGNLCDEDEVRDSMLCGSLVRCRACLVKIGLPSVEMVIGA
jgi:hypothetical protein